MALALASTYVIMNRRVVLFTAKVRLNLPWLSDDAIIALFWIYELNYALP